VLAMSRRRRNDPRVDATYELSSIATFSSVITVDDHVPGVPRVRLGRVGSSRSRLVRLRLTSANAPEADLRTAIAHVRFGPIAGIGGGAAPTQPWSAGSVDCAALILFACNRGIRLMRGGRATAARNRAFSQQRPVD
jgi:hypothetical protein